MSSLQGLNLGNRYILCEKIGEGGMALVYKAKCQLLNRYVAVKILRPEFTADEEFVKKFKRESLASASLSHPNIVGIHDVGEQDGIYYIVMEYINGKTLKEYIKEHGKLDYRETLRIVNQIALALDNAHRNGVIHRDIKPHNILITDDKIIKVTDFGIARASTSTTMTNTGSVMGSVHYFSPEQARGGFTDHRTDIYSLGVVMYEMLTGSLPYDAESPISVALKHIQDKFVEPSEIDNTIPRAVNDIVVSAMEKDMTKRYQNVREMIEDIELAQDNPDANILQRRNENEMTRVIPVNEIDEVLAKDKKSTRKNRKKNIIIVSAITVVTVLILLSLGYYGFNKYFIVKDVKIPNIVGSQEADAKKTIEDSKLVFVVADRVSSDKPIGEIVMVFPDEGTIVKENSPVRVTVSSGPQSVEVPDLTNQDVATAESTLKSFGLILNKGNIERQNSDTVPKDMIMDQNPKPSSQALAGSQVNIIVSNGPEIQNVTVPPVIGKDLSDAIKALNLAHLQVGKISTSIDNNFIDGVVIGLDIAEGTQVPENTVINLTINKLDSGSVDNQQNTDTNTGDNTGQ